VETGTPEGEWLDKLASLVRRAALGQKEQHSRTTNGEPSARSQAPVASTAGGSDLRSKLNDLRVHEDARTIQERIREWRHLADDEQESSGVPVSAATPSDDDIGPYGAGCRAFTVDLWRGDWPMKFRPDLLEKYDDTIDPEEFLHIYTTAI
jgi:hypothetical protein